MSRVLGTRHDDRFEQMEPGLPDQYRSEDRFEELRSAHDSMIKEGVRTLSASYMGDFLQAARAKLKGSVCQVGDRIVVYDVARTDPDGLVQATGDTVLRFE